MRQRRVSKTLAGLAALCLAGVAVLGALSVIAAHRGSLSHGVAALRAAADSWSRPIGRYVLPAVAAAGEVLDFKPVPRESVARFERMRIIRHSPAPDPTDTLSFDRSEAPEPAEPAIPPDPVVDRSGGIMKIGSDIHVGPDEVIHGDLSSVNGDITIEGHVEGDVVAMRGDVDLKSTARVDGDVVCLGGTLNEDPGARVGGQKVTAPGGGSWTHAYGHERARERHEGGGVTNALVWLLVLALIGWMFVRFGPGRTAAGAETLMRSPGLSLGIGSMVWALIIPSLIALSLVVALLCITIIGIPLALAALVGYGLFLAVLAVWGFVVGATVLGSGLLRAPHNAAVPGMTTPLGTPVVADIPMTSGLVGPHAVGPTLTRPMLIGVSVLMGSIMLGSLLHTTDVGPLHGFGTLLIVLGIVASSLATTVGAGALMKSEISMGTFQRIWSGRRFGIGRGTATPAAAPASSTPWPPVTPPPPPSPPASPTAAYMPPGTAGSGESGPSPTPPVPPVEPPPIS